MIVALEVPSDIDLALFSAFLNQQGIAHRISEEGVNLVVWVEREEERARVVHLYTRVSSGEIVLKGEDGRQTKPATFSRRLAANLWRYPLTMALIAINLILLPIGLNTTALLHENSLLHSMTLLQFELIGRDLFFATLAETFIAGEFWRLLTPMFLHFSWLHIVFNMLWVWEIGRRIELLAGTSTLLLVTLVSSLGANLTQYIMGGAGLFGGMSGVVFGYLGYCLVWDRLVPDQSTGLRPAIYWVMLAFLVLGFTGAFDLLQLGALANGAHLGGLVCGSVTGAIAVMLHRSLPDPRQG